jgi:hypothetical protein
LDSSISNTAIVGPIWPPFGATSVEIFHDDTVDPLRSLDDFAAQTAAMDLVLSVDNSTVHMAGALNVPVWALLPAVPDWRWLLGRTDSPWYSSVRLFRQSIAGEWAPVIDVVAQELGRAFGTPELDGPARVFQVWASHAD